jgi:hypothetical protein
MGHHIGHKEREREDGATRGSLRTYRMQTMLPTLDDTQRGSARSCTHVTKKVQYHCHNDQHKPLCCQKQNKTDVCAGDLQPRRRSEEWMGRTDGRGREAAEGGDGWERKRRTGSVAVAALVVALPCEDLIQTLRPRSSRTLPQRAHPIDVSSSAPTLAYLSKK